MSIVEYRSLASHKYYMRKTKDEIIARIDMMRSALKLDPLDKMKILDWDKWSLAHEAMKTHDLFPAPNPYRQSYVDFEWVKKMDGIACNHFILNYTYQEDKEVMCIETV